MTNDHSPTPTKMPACAQEAVVGHSGSPGAAPAPSEDAVLRRTPDGWRVGADDVPDLTCAMVLADLFAAEFAADDGAGPPAAPDGPDAPDAPDGQSRQAQATGTQADPHESSADEARRLRATVSQLQHALTARIRVEQAIGVLAERHRIRPRQAFEQLRSAARNRGRRVIDIAADVVASASNPLLQLPEELARPRSGSRHGSRQRRLAEPEA
jgi:hypothetical protein